MSSVDPSVVAAASSRFELHALLGEGSFGEVYLATMVNSVGLRQDVAVKILHAQLDPRSQPIARLRDEARVLATLQHPVILQVRDLIVLAGRAALVTEYVPGADLAWVLAAEDRLPERFSLEIIGHVADALDTAVNAVARDGRPMRLQHRDIKPANIRVTPHGTVKLLDFGIAKAQEVERESDTAEFTLIGSLPYMAPEALHLDASATEGARDVYALGATLFEMLTGERLFRDFTRGEQRRMTARPERHDEYIDERMSAMASAGEPVRALVRHMLAYAPADRPTAHQVAERAFALADQAGGATLRSWCRGWTWPDETATGGVWTGRVVEASAVSSTAFAVLSSAALSRIDEGTVVRETPAPTLEEPLSSPFAGSETGVAPRLVLPDQHSPVRRLWPLVLLGVAVGGLAVGALILWRIEVALAPSEAALSVPSVAVAPVVGVPPSLAAPPAPIAVPAAPTTPASPVASPSPQAGSREVSSRHRAPATSANAGSMHKPAAPVTKQLVTSAVRPAVTPKTGTLRVEGADSVVVELRRGSERASPGTVAAGTWAVWAKFGDAYVEQLSVTVPAGGTVTVRCRKLLAYCEAQP